MMAPARGEGVAIGIDIGTSGARAALVGADGGLLAMGSAALESGRDPQAWWRAVEGALDALRGAADLSGVRGVAVDGTSGTVLVLDGDGAPLGAASLYSDIAPEAALRAVSGAAPPGSAALGAASPLARLLALRARPGAVRMAHQADWIAHRLGAPLGVSDENNALKTGYDPVGACWPGWLGALGVLAMLPEVVRPGTRIGAVGAAQCRRFGLKPGTAIVAGTTDGCAAFLATGARELGEAVTSLGSTLTLKLLCERPVVAAEYGVYSHRLGGRWLAGGASNSGGAALARYFSPASLAALSRLIDPAQASGLDYYPLPRPGERFPVADAGLLPRETPRPADDALFLHGLLEGVARIEAQGYARLAALGAPAVVALRSVGGGAGNAVWTEIRRRMLGVEFRAARSAEAAVGVASLVLG
jgi:sugar (pentulose or hexulose) kinase